MKSISNTHLIWIQRRLTHVPKFQNILLKKFLDFECVSYTTSTNLLKTCVYFLGIIFQWDHLLCFFVWKLTYGIWKEPRKPVFEFNKKYSNQILLEWHFVMNRIWLKTNFKDWVIHIIETHYLFYFWKTRLLFDIL